MNTSLKVLQCDLFRCSLSRLGERLYDGSYKLKQVLQYVQNRYQIKLGNGNKYIFEQAGAQLPKHQQRSSGGHYSRCRHPNLLNALFGTSMSMARLALLALAWPAPPVVRMSNARTPPPASASAARGTTP